jgi:hypothetical protein
MAHQRCPSGARKDGGAIGAAVIRQQTPNADPAPTKPADRTRKNAAQSRAR